MDVINECLSQSSKSDIISMSSTRSGTTSRSSTAQLLLNLFVAHHLEYGFNVIVL